MFAADLLFNAILDQREAKDNNQIPTTSEPRIIVFSTVSHIIDNLVYVDMPYQAQVRATSQTVLTQQGHRQEVNKNDYKLLSLDTLANPIHVNYKYDTFFFQDNKAFEVFFDCVKNPLEYPSSNQVSNISEVFGRVRHLAIGGIVLSPVILETLLCFENLYSLRFDSRIIISTLPKDRQDTEQEFANWYQTQLRERGYTAPKIEWVWDLEYWFNRRSAISEQASVRGAHDGRLFERNDEKPMMSSFMRQCLDESRRFVARDCKVFAQRPWIPSGPYRN
jgi:hypothetical protein